MRRSTGRKVVSVLPEELLIEILLRLPVPTLLRCKSVSKQWLRLLTSQYFVQCQLDYAIKNNPRILFSAIRKFMCLFSLFSLEYETSYSDKTCYKTEFLSSYTISGSCNGLVCLWGNCSVFLCNRATREYIRVLDDIDWDSHLGFGHDPLTNTYKLVKIIDSDPFSVSQFPDYQVYVYKFGTKKWRTKTSRIPFCLGNLEERGLCLNGVVHWRSTTSIDDQNFDSIVGFDVGKEEFRQIPWIPTSTANQRSDCIYLSKKRRSDCIGEIQGCLSLISTSYDDDTTDIWYMKDYGVQESWTKLYSLSPSYDRVPSLEFLKKTETFISASLHKYMYTYNRTNNTVHQYAIDKDTGDDAHAYVESLVSIASLNMGKRQSQRNRRPPDRLNP